MRTTRGESLGVTNQGTRPAWALHFKVDDFLWSKITALATQKGLSTVEVALQGKFLKEQELLLFEKESSRLPILKTDFFDGPVPFDLLKKYDYKSCRAHFCMPVMDWNGNIYWAKLTAEMTGFEQKGLEHLWFLASFSSLMKWFQQWQEKIVDEVSVSYNTGYASAPSIDFDRMAMEESPKPTVEPQMPVAPPLPVPNPVRPAPSSAKPEVVHQVPEPETPSVNPSFELEFVIDTAQVAPVEIEPLPVPDQKNVPISAPVPVPSLKADSLGPLHVLEKTFVEPKPETVIITTNSEKIEPQTKSGVDLPLFAKPKGNENIKENSFPDLPSSPKPGPAPISDSGEFPQGLSRIGPEVTRTLDFSSLLGSGSAEAPGPAAAGPSQASAPVPVPEPDPVSVPAETLHPTENLQPTELIVPVSSNAEPPLAPPPPPESSDPSIKKTGIPTIPTGQFESRLRLAGHQDALAEVLMGHWQNNFPHVMILLTQQHHLDIWWNNETFASPVNRGEKVPIESPSVFRFVLYSGLPYHGYVAKNEVHDQFFGRFLNGKYPDHVTLIPIMANERVVAMVLGLCDQAAAAHLVLSRLEEEAKLFSSYLARLPQITQKAS